MSCPPPPQKKLPFFHNMLSDFALSIIMKHRSTLVTQGRSKTLMKKPTENTILGCKQAMNGTDKFYQGFFGSIPFSIFADILLFLYTLVNSVSFLRNTQEEILEVIVILLLVVWHDTSVRNTLWCKHRYMYVNGSSVEHKRKCKARKGNPSSLRIGKLFSIFFFFLIVCVHPLNVYTVVKRSTLLLAS